MYERNIARMARRKFSHCFDKSKTFVVTDGSTELDDVHIASLARLSYSLLYKAC